MAVCLSCGWWQRGGHVWRRHSVSWHAQPGSDTSPTAAVLSNVPVLHAPAAATQVVLLAALMTVGITGCLTLYALQTKRDFTASGG